MAYNPFAENVSRVSSMSKDAKDAAAAALKEGHSILKEAGLDLPDIADRMDASQAELESVGAGAAQLEAIVRVVNRPPMLIRNGAVEQVPLPLSAFPAGTDIKIKAAEPLIGSIGRIEFTNCDTAWGGTGWVIERDGAGHFLVATNRHVAKIVARRTAFGTGAFLFDPFGAGRYGAAINFNAKIDAPADLAKLAPILKFTYLAADDAADVAIARIAIPTEFDVEPLVLSNVEARDKDLIAVIGYPARDSRNDITHMERYFQGLYDVKRFSPGFVHGSSASQRLTYDATTLGGNSGSPVISLDTRKVLGLHFAGRYAIGNSAVRASTLKALMAGERTVVGVGTADGAANTDEGRDGVHTPAELADRPGYNVAFLDHFEVPWPDVSGVDNVMLAKPSDATASRPHELRYQHFGILYCTKFKSPVVTAVNIDGATSARVKRGSDRWFYDLRIEQKDQIGSEAYSEAGVDRGHMVKREDPNWGTDPDVVRRANFDTFHFTNCSPQHGRFNRNIATWRGLEDYLIDNSRTHGFKASVFTGPILAEDMDVIEELDLFLPREYWKVVVMPAEQDDGSVRPHATAYLLSQGQLIQKLMQDRGRSEAVEGFAFGEYRTFQIPIATLEKETGIDFGELRKFDPLATAVEEDAPRGYLAIDALSDLKL